MIEEAIAGLRPMTPDNVPLVEERDGMLVATGHGRNGVLLAPLTGELVAEMLERGRGTIPPDAGPLGSSAKMVR